MPDLAHGSQHEPPATDAVEPAAYDWTVVVRWHLTSKVPVSARVIAETLRLHEPTLMPWWDPWEVVRMNPGHTG